ncbi:MAG TPA: hypothetical protein PKA13_03010 [Geminicoccaceae bacterium]|nr:hypothetical protein [Geminicoccus sp.]HMU48716.1 hypothetical protein [Geminicoccaceae bacterium]
MPDVSLGSFRQLAQTMRTDERVKLDGALPDGTRGVRASSNLGTKAARWLNNAFGVKDDAIKAFKATVRRELGGDEQAAQRVFAVAGIRVSKVLTGERLVAALNRLTVERNRAQGGGNDTGGGNALQAFHDAQRDTTESTSQSQRDSLPIGRRDSLSVSDDSDALPRSPLSPAMQSASKAWSDFAAHLGNGTPQGMFMRWNAAAELANAPLDQLSGPERQKLQSLIGPQVGSLVDTVGELIGYDSTQTAKFAGLLDLVAPLIDPGDKARIDQVDGWQATARLQQQQSKQKEPEPGERLADLRDELADLRAGLDSGTGDRTATLKAYADLGGKLLAAVLENTPEDDRDVHSAKAGFLARLAYDPSRHDDLVGLLLDPSRSKPRLDLLPDPKTHPNEYATVMRAAVDAFARDYGGFENLQARNALLKAGVPEALLEPMRERAVKDLSSGESVAQLRLHGATKLPRTVDFASTLARETALHDLGKPLTFESTGVSGGKLVPPPLDREVDLDSVPRAKGFGQVLGRELGDGEVPKAEANGRTLRFTEPDGSIVALKFMKAKEREEEPGKLHREHESFALMKDALGKDYQAQPRTFTVGDQDHPVVRISRDDLPPDARRTLDEELTRKGMKLAEEDGCYYCMSYRVTGGDEVEAGDYFAYLEDTHDDAGFGSGFKSSMETLGKMAAKGFFDPNLIANSYHDKDSSRPWVWSPDLFIPWKDTAGEEERPLANAQYSNFRVGGLADPDEFRHISQVLDTEFATMVGRSGVQNDIQDSDTGDKETKLRLTTAFLVGRMVHEALVVATRRMVLEGAFEPSTPKQRQDELVATFKQSVRQGIEAFATAFTGQPADKVHEALEANGLDLDSALDGIVAERRALYSFAYTDKLRERDGGYFGQVFGIDSQRIEFGPKSEDELARDKGVRTMTSRAEVLRSPDPIVTLKATVPPGWVAVVGVDADDKPVHLDDLGWMVRIDDQAKAVFDRPDGSGGVTVDAPPGTEVGPTVVRVKVDSAEDFRDYMDKLKARSHTLQNTGEWNGGYFFLNEMSANNILSATLVGLRVG